MVNACVNGSCKLRMVLARAMCEYRELRDASPDKRFRHNCNRMVKELRHLYPIINEITKEEQ